MNGDLILIKEIKSFPGFAYGLRSPSLQVSLIINENKSLSYISSFFEEIGILSPEVVAGISLQKEDITVSEVIDGILLILGNIFRLAKVPVFEFPCLLNSAQVGALESNEFVLLIPTCVYGERYSIFVLRWLLSLINKFMDANEYAAELKNIEKVCNSAKFLSLYGSNFKHFSSAAYEIGIQVSFVVDKIFQFGQGKNARWMDSSFTDETSQLGSSLARNKMATSRVLRAAGIPVPDHELVKNLQQALQAAHKMNYPVVVKPLDLDGGLGVAADIRSDKELTLAYSEAIKYSKNVLIEKHIDGRDYRINIFHGDVLWAIERVYAGVMGDGHSSIRILIDHANRDVRRGADNKSPLRAIVIDQEMLDFLESRNLNLNSIPKKNQFVQLRRRANIASGGLPMAVMDKIHEDNKSLAIRAVAALKLDLAGVDLIIPDISKSWMSVGGGICEINAQPQLGSVTSIHSYAEVLKGLVKRNGRIPIVLIVGGDQDFYNKLSSCFERNGLRVGLYQDFKIFSSSNVISDQAKDFYSAGVALIRDNTLGAIIMQLSDLSILNVGLPFDRFDSLIIVEDNSSHIVGQLEEVVNMLLPACDGDIYLAPDFNVDFLNELDSKVNIVRESSLKIKPESFIRVLCDNLTTKYQ